MVGTKHTAKRLPEKIVSSTMPPGGLSATTAATTANATTQMRVQTTMRAFSAPSTPVVDEGACSKRPAMSRVVTDAATSNTLSSEDIAAARMATTRKSRASGGKTVPSRTSVGTIKSVSVTPSSRKRAYRPTGNRQN